MDKLSENEKIEKKLREIELSREARMLKRSDWKTLVGLGSCSGPASSG